MKKLIISLLFVILLCDLTDADGPKYLSRERWRYEYDSLNGWLYISIWPKRPWLDVSEFVSDDGERSVDRLQRLSTSELMIVDVSINRGVVVVVTATEKWAWAQVFQVISNPVRFDRVKEKPILPRNIIFG